MYIPRTLSLPTIGETGLDLLLSMLVYVPDCRISAEEALNHVYFNDVPIHIRNMS